MVLGDNDDDKVNNDDNDENYNSSYIKNDDEKHNDHGNDNDHNTNTNDIIKIIYSI